MLPPLHYILIPSVIAFFSGVAAALLTIFLTPRFQHYFWKRQKREELRFSVIAEVNRLAAEFITFYLYGEKNSDMFPPPSGVFFQSWEIASGQVNNLFSDSTGQAFDKMFRSMEFCLKSSANSPQEFTVRMQHIEKFREELSNTMREFYKDIGIL